ncbi:MAG: mechanosensitive ion channel [Candidatus Omnitrophota bacterium]|nr:MAG: mechanosensitive ion channel [Candidatus Omnitrophota bacterium]
MVEFAGIFQELVVRRIEQLYQFTVNTGPKIFLAVFILLIGWVCALLLKKIIAKLLKAFGFDVLAQKLALKNFLEKGGVSKRPSLIVGSGFYWLIMFSALVMAFNTLELPAASQLIRAAVLYIPKIIVAFIFVALGMFLSQFMAQFVGASARLAKIPFHRFLEKLTKYVIVGLAVMFALEYLGVTTTVVMEYMVIIFGVIVLAVSLIFLIGAREIVSCMLAGRFLLKIYTKADIIEFDSVSGQIESIDLITTKIKSEKGQVIIPNSELVKKVVKRIK